MNDDELIQLNYKQPKRLELFWLLGYKIVFMYGTKTRTGVVTKVYRDWQGKERIKIAHDGKILVTTEYYKSEFEREILNNTLKIVK